MGRDGIAGLAVALAAAALFWQSLALPANPFTPLGAGDYPRAVLAIAIACGLVLATSDAVRAWRLRRAGGPPAETGRRPVLPPNAGLVAATFAAFAAYVIAMPLVGFRVATFLFVLGAGAALRRPTDARGWGAVLAVALATAAVTYLVFEAYLTVLLPRGRWTGF